MAGKAGLPGAAALVLAGCNRVQTGLEPAGDQASAIHGLGQLFFWVCAAMYVLVLGFLAVALWRGRHKLRDLTPATSTPGEAGLTRTLYGWTALIVVGLFVLTAGSFLVDRALAHVGPQPIKLKVSANQWWWRIEYPDEADPSQTVITANELHLPLNRTAEIELASNDVIHSFWLPNLHGKTDLIPGRTNKIVLTPRKLGLFRGQCAEFCGLQHARMAFEVKVDTPADFAAWKARQVAPAAEPVTPLAQHGREAFLQTACSNCHAVRGTEAGGTVAPDLTHLASRRTIAAGTLPFSRGALQAWIADPQSQKPGTNMPAVGLTPDQLNGVVAYLETLK
jgi:cytochrome c oxidase subunit 2